MFPVAQSVVLLMLQVQPSCFSRRMLEVSFTLLLFYGVQLPFAHFYYCISIVVANFCLCWFKPFTTTEGKGFLFSDEMDLSIDSFGRSRKALSGWDGESVENMEFIDLGFSEMPKRQFYGGSATSFGLLCSSGEVSFG